MSKTKYFFVIFFTLLFLSAANYFLKERKFYPGTETITSSSLMEKVEYLASPELDGRLSGSEGYNKAAEYAANIFSGIGLNNFEGSYFQNFNVEYNKINQPVEFGLVYDNNMIKNYQIGEDFVCRGFTGSGNFTSDVVFCGYGISAPELGYDDYANIDVNEKVVIVFKYNPKWKSKNGSWPAGYPRNKSNIAKEKGAIGILFVSLPNDNDPQKTIGSILSGSGEQPEDFPQLHISIDAANEILQKSGLTLAQLQTLIDSTKQPQSVETNSTVKINVNAEYSKEQPTMNVVGWIEGKDENLKNEFVVIGAHLDHVGRQGEIYFPGANDNASGSAAVLEMAKAFRSQNVSTKRSIIFALFASEEIGLAGSKYFAEHPPVPIDQITAMLNLDCIGYGDSIRLGNGKSAPKLWELAKQIDNENFNYTVESTWAGGGADASPFHEKGIPSIYFVTTNSYDHLHYITDTPETLNKPLFEKISRLAYMTAYEVAQNNYHREILVK